MATIPKQQSPFEEGYTIPKGFSFTQVLCKVEIHKKEKYCCITIGLSMSESVETIQEIAYKLMLEQKKNEFFLSGPLERTTFVLGSKGVVSESFKR